MEPKATVEDVGSFVKVLRDLTNAEMIGRPLWFRGHRNSVYRLQASALREEKYRKNEVPMLKRFMQDAQSRLMEAPRGEWDSILLAQHHGVPTRLLDWSENALVGLFFACERDDSVLEGMPEPNGDVWVLMPERLNVESGTWSGVHAEDLPFLDVDDSLQKYNPMVPTAAQVPVKHIAVIAARNFPRIVNQWGTFTVTGELNAIEDLPNVDKFLVRVAVSGPAKREILRELSSLGVEERVVYPDLHRLGSRVKELFS